MSRYESTAFVVRHRVRKGAEGRYEDWLRKIVPVAASYPGHQGAHIVRPTPNNDEYVIVVRFSTLDQAKTWIESDDRKRLVKEIDDAISGDDTELKSGIDFWFTPPAEKRAPGWKQWLVTTSVIAPLTMIVPAALKPLFLAVPWLATYGVSHVLVASTIVALVTFVIMPRYVRLLRRWLYA